MASSGVGVLAVIAIYLPAFLLSALFVAVLALAIKALVKYINSSNSGGDPVREKLSLRLRELRTRRGMTQEYVAEQLSVSRQAVSKWETGSAEPSTSNLIALARLYGVTVDELCG